MGILKFTFKVIIQQMLSATKEHKSVDFKIPHKKRIQNYLYQPEKLLGKGCFSTVHPGVHLSSNQAMAIKVVKLASMSNPKMRELLDQETEIVCSLNHPNIIRCYEVMRSNNHCYFAMELCEQGSLEKNLKQKKRYTEHQVAPILENIYQGLRYLEKQGIVHRDLKTANVFVKGGVAKIADFGFAVRTRIQLKDIKIGSPLYMAPEALLSGVYSPKTDSWAFGVLLYELLHGRTPFSHCRTQMELRVSVSKEINESDLRSDLSQEMKQLILSCLQIQEEKRLTVPQLANLPYFRKHTRKNHFFGIQNLCFRANTPSFGNTKSLFVSNVGSPMNFQRGNVKALTMFSPPHSNFIEQKQLTTFLSVSRKEVQIEASTNSSISSNFQSYLLKGKLSLKESIGLIHFCRLGFRILSQNATTLLKSCIKALIIKILQDIEVKLQIDEIVFTQKEVDQARDKKLNQVLMEYLIKYRSVELPTEGVNSRLTMKAGEQQLRTLNAAIKNEDTGRFAYFLGTFLSFLQIFQQCIKLKDFSRFSEKNSGVLQVCLTSL